MTKVIREDDKREVEERKEIGRAERKEKGKGGEGRMMKT